MGAAGLARVHERFSADIMVKKTLEVYERLTQPSGFSRKPPRERACLAGARSVKAGDFQPD
jgi:hypothetical protein